MIAYFVSLEGQDCCTHKAVFTVLKIAKEYAKNLSENMTKRDKIYTPNVVITKYHVDMPNKEPDIIQRIEGEYYDFENEETI